MQGLWGVMTKPSEDLELDIVAIAKAKSDPEFEETGWITFYLTGDPESHEKMKPSLMAMGAVNLDGAEGGTVYAKLPVSIDELSITRCVSKTGVLAAQFGIQIDLVDLDSSKDVKTSKFYTLWTSGVDQ